MPELKLMFQGLENTLNVKSIRLLQTHQRMFRKENNSSDIKTVSVVQAPNSLIWRCQSV